MHKRKDGYICFHKTLQHREIIEKSIGRKLESYEIVHHINEDRSDNRLENLEVMSVGEHLQMHNLKNPIVDGLKTCSKCLKRQPIKEFIIEKRIKSMYRAECRTCRNIRQKAYYHRIKFERPQIYHLDLSRLKKSA